MRRGVEEVKVFLLRACMWGLYYLFDQENLKEEQERWLKFPVPRSLNGS